LRIISFPEATPTIKGGYEVLQNPEYKIQRSSWWVD